MGIALIPGSFDPMTMGHLDLIRRVASQHREVVVALMINPQKNYTYDRETRLEIARRTLASLPNVRVIADDGMLIDLFDRIGAEVVCKGWRNETDLAYEREMAAWNEAHNPRCRTELIRSEGEHATLSSTEIRRYLREGCLPAGLVHPDAEELIRSAFRCDKPENSANV